MTVIEGAQYETTRRELMEDPLIQQMAQSIPIEALPLITHEDGTPHLDFMIKANRRYRDLGGTRGGHIGAVAEAILRIKAHA